MYKTKQEYYDDIIARYRDGRLPCYELNEYRDVECRYNLNGKQCLIGMLIQECYSPKFETRTAYSIFDEISKFLPSFMINTTKTELELIQRIHDRNINNSQRAVIELNNHPFFSDVIKQEL